MARNNVDVEGNLGKQINYLYVVMTGVVLVLLVGLAQGLVALGGMRQEQAAQREATYQDLRDQVKSQNDKIDNLTTDINTLTKDLEAEQKTTPATN